LRFDSTGHVRIWIDGRIVMDRGPDEQGFESRLDLSDRPHSLWVELSHPAGFSVARLLWATADADKLQPIPGDALSPESEVLRSDSR
jgi:hypothetical protein